MFTSEMICLECSFLVVNSKKDKKYKGFQQMQWNECYVLGQLDMPHDVCNFESENLLQCEKSTMFVNKTFNSCAVVKCLKYIQSNHNGGFFYGCYNDVEIEDMEAQR